MGGYIFPSQRPTMGLFGKLHRAIKGTYYIKGYLGDYL
jgi:hypothetical protein